MKQKKLFITVIALLLIGLLTVSYFVAPNRGVQKPFYVGVTYCGSSVQEAKELTDQVKNYTNLFVLQSGVLQWNITAVEEIGDYAVASNLSYAVYGGTRNTVISNKWLNEAKERWGEQFIGIYYNDEVGGYMLDRTVMLETVHQTENIQQAVMPKIEKTEKGAIILHTQKENETAVSSTITFWPDGKIIIENSETIIYYPNGTITIYENKKDKTNSSENITKYPLPLLPYETVLKQNPIQTYDDAAKAYVNMNKELLAEINNTQLKKEHILVFTADYGLYWWDYQSGYDLVLAELAWNNSITQQIALTRGAANIQNKQWGTMITWKYTHPPYLTNGEEMFEQMKISYEAGAEYVIVFNYSEDPTNPNTLQEEHFLALERFWEEVVQNPEVAHGGIKAEAALVLPQNYGWGLRIKDDNIWGIWPANETTIDIWDQLQEKSEKHGLKLDIIFDDPNYSTLWKYHTVYHWNKK